jgi:hypothetical protein
MPSKVKYLLTSRKFWAALIGLLMVILRNFVPDFPIAEDQITAVVVLIASYILGTAIDDRNAQPDR